MSQFMLNTKGRRSLVVYCTECEGRPMLLKIETVEEIDYSRKGLMLQSDIGATVTIRCPKGHEQRLEFQPGADVAI